MLFAKISSLIFFSVNHLKIAQKTLLNWVVHAMSTEWMARSEYCAYYVFVTPCSVRHGMDTYRSETEQLLSLLAAAGAASESSDERRSGQTQHGSQASREPPAISRRRKVWIGKKTGRCLCLLATGERGAAFAGLLASGFSNVRLPLLLVQQDAKGPVHPSLQGQ